MARAAQPVARCVEHSRQPRCVQISRHCLGLAVGAGHEPDQRPVFEGMHHPVATTSELAATACQLPSIGTISPLDAFHAAARDATPVA